MLNIDARDTARPAKFAQSSQHRRSMLAKIHVAKKQLALAEDDYRQILLDEAGVGSAADASEAGLKAVLRRFEGLGFKPLPKKGTPGAAQHPVARKARALWISLYHLGVIENRSEKALEAFAKRQLGCERLVWADQSQGHRLIEALKAMATRGGWELHDHAGRPLGVRELQRSLCEAIVAKLKELGEIPADWSLDLAAWRLCGIETGAEGPTGAEGYTALATVLGAKLRQLGGGR